MGGAGAAGTGLFYPNEPGLQGSTSHIYWMSKSECEVVATQSHLELPLFADTLA